MITLLIALLAGLATVGSMVWWERQMLRARLRMLLAGAKTEDERRASVQVAFLYGMHVTAADDTVWRANLQHMEEAMRHANEARRARRAAQGWD